MSPDTRKLKTIQELFWGLKLWFSVSRKMMNFRKMAIKFERLVVASQNLSWIKGETSLYQMLYTTWVYHILNSQGEKVGGKNTMDFKIQVLLNGISVIKKLAKNPDSWISTPFIHRNLFFKESNLNMGKWPFFWMVIAWRRILWYLNHLIMASVTSSMTSLSKIA